MINTELTAYKVKLLNRSPKLVVNTIKLIWATTFI